MIAMQAAFFQNMTPEARAKSFFEMVQEVRETVERSIKEKHPEYTDLEVLLAVVDRY